MCGICSKSSWAKLCVWGGNGVASMCAIWLFATEEMWFLVSDWLATPGLCDVKLKNVASTIFHLANPWTVLCSWRALEETQDVVLRSCACTLFACTQSVLLVRAPRLLSHSIASATTHGHQHDRVDRVVAVQPMRAHEQRKYFHVHWILPSLPVKILYAF